MAIDVELAAENAATPEFTMLTPLPRLNIPVSYTHLTLPTKRIV